MKREIKIGLFTIAMILCVWGGVRFLSGIDLLSSNADYYAYYGEIDGIQKASAVYIKGVKVGTVTAIELDDERSSQVRLTLTIAKSHKIPKDSEAVVFNNGIMSGKAVKIVFGDSEDYIESDGVIASGYDVDLFDVAGSELSHLKGRIDEVATVLASTLLNVNRLLESNAESVGATVENMNQLSANLNRLLVRNEEDITLLIGGVADLSQSVSNKSVQIDSIIYNINSVTRDLNEANLGESLAVSLSQIEQVMTQLNGTEGSIGLMLRDEELYRNLSSASANLDSLLYDVKANPKRYVNISVFGANEEKSRLKAEKRARKDAEEAAKDLAKKQEKR